MRRQWLAVGAALLLSSVVRAQDPTKPTRPLQYDLRRPLCQQTQLSPELMAVLTPPSAAVLGLPTAVRVEVPALTGGVGAVRVSAVASGPAGVGAAVHLDGAGAVNIGINPDDLTGGETAALLARVRAGDTAADLDQALRQLPAAELFAEVRRCPWWSEHDQALADRLLGVLLERGEVDPAHPDTLSGDLPLMLAECLRRRVDARCVPLFERLLATREAQPASDWVQAVYGLATYYRLAGDYQRSAQVWLSGDRYTTSPAVFDDYRLEAAWTLRACGDEARATQLEDELLKSTSGAAWTIGLVTYGRAQSLLLSGKHTELRALLSGPVPLGGAPADSSAALAVRVALDGMLADSYARTGERDQAATIYRRVVQGAEALPEGQNGNGLASVVATARERLAELAGPGGH